MDTAKVAKGIRIYGAILTVGIIIAILVSIFTGGASKPLNKDENTHWADPTEQK